MNFLIKLLIPMMPRLIEFAISIIMNILKDKVKDNSSDVDDKMYEILENERGNLTVLAIRKARETGIYKKLKSMEME